MQKARFVSRLAVFALELLYGEFKHGRYPVHASLPSDNGQSMHSQLGGELFLGETQARANLLQFYWFHSRLHCHSSIRLVMIFLSNDGGRLGLSRRLRLPARQELQAILKQLQVVSPLLQVVFCQVHVKFQF